MPKYDLDDLLGALNAVASSSDPDGDSDRDPNDDPDNGDFDPNDDPDNVDDPEDVNDDPRSYRDDDDADDDYSSKRAVMLLEKLNSESCWTLDRSIAQRVAKAKQLNKPINKTELNLSKIAALREKTSQINFEMKTDKLLTAETKKHREASVALYLAHLTPEEKREHDEDMRRIAEYYSAIYPEASPDWREQARAEFQNKRLS